MYKRGSKSVQFNLRFRPIQLLRLRQAAEKVGFITLAQFIREAINEKILRGKNGK
ncbi:MAG: hypothetical protein ABIG69_14775 [Bacteroidota bacterium]